VGVTLRSRSKEKWTMSILTIAALMLATITAASAQNQTTFRDANGQTTGTATTYGNTTTFRDGRGQTTGTATRENNGTTTFRNNLGQQTGTATAPRR
jgi:hypothetical protein